jgi:hypothetical protein
LSAARFEAEGGLAWLSGDWLSGDWLVEEVMIELGQDVGRGDERVLVTIWVQVRAQGTEMVSATRHPVKISNLCSNHLEALNGSYSVFRTPFCFTGYLSCRALLWFSPSLQFFFFPFIFADFLLPTSPILTCPMVLLVWGPCGAQSTIRTCLGSPFPR